MRLTTLIFSILILLLQQTNCTGMESPDLDTFLRLTDTDENLFPFLQNESFFSENYRSYDDVPASAETNPTINTSSLSPNTNEKPDLLTMLGGEVSLFNDDVSVPATQEMSYSCLPCRAHAPELLFADSFSFAHGSQSIYEPTMIAGPSQLPFYSFQSPIQSRIEYPALPPVQPVLGYPAPFLPNNQNYYSRYFSPHITSVPPYNGGYQSDSRYPDRASGGRNFLIPNYGYPPFSGQVLSSPNAGSQPPKKQKFVFIPYQLEGGSQAYNPPFSSQDGMTQSGDQTTLTGDLPQPKKKKRKEREESENFDFIQIVKKRRKAESSQTTSHLTQEASAPRRKNKKSQVNKRKMFEERIGYELTQGQKKAIQDIDADWASSESIDRVIIAPVGAGKTEVAMHAALKAIEAGNQVVLLSPRCALAQQHFNNFQARFNGIANVTYIPSSYTKSERNFVYSKIKKGEYDIIIGTHSLLTQAIKYKKLGLAIIDEEQNFGVKQKEFLCEKYPDANTLILTATPIPRTQELIKTGYYRSTKIDTLPEGRLPIEVTIAPSVSMELASSYISAEKKRNGQIFFVTSKITSLSFLEDFLKESHSDITFNSLHGRMKKEEQDQVLQAFRNREFDLLLSTNIIGVGIDIPNANTIIIHDANKFGLAELYQMKGRVGRGPVQGYTCLLYGEKTTAQSLAKLQAIEKFSGLNDCAKISEIDLEIRGSGDVLSTSQHGHFGKQSREKLEKYLKGEDVSHQGGDQ